MSRFNVWKKIGLGAAVLLVIAAPAALHLVSAAPELRPSGAALPAQVAVTKPFVPVCNAAEVGDTRPDPAWTSASFEHDNCWAPSIPATLNGYTATRNQIVAGMAAVKRYIALSDVFQKCISDFVTVRKAQADKANKPADVALIIIENHRITVSQENKKRAANQIKVAINAFNEYGSECPD